MKHWTVGGGGFEQTHQHRRLVDVELRWCLVEEGLGCSLHAEGVAAEIHGVEIHGDDFLFGVVVLQLHGYHPLAELGEDGAALDVHLAHLVEVFG